MSEASGPAVSATQVSTPVCTASSTAIDASRPFGKVSQSRRSTPASASRRARARCSWTRCGTRAQVGPVAILQRSHATRDAMIMGHVASCEPDCSARELLPSPTDGATCGAESCGRVDGRPGGSVVAVDVTDDVLSNLEGMGAPGWRRIERYLFGLARCPSARRARPRAGRNASCLHFSPPIPPCARLTQGRQFSNNARRIAMLGGRDETVELECPQCGAKVKTTAKEAEKGRGQVAREGRGARRMRPAAPAAPRYTHVPVPARWSPRSPPCLPPRASPPPRRGDTRDPARARGCAGRAIARGRDPPGRWCPRRRAREPPARRSATPSPRAPTPGAPAPARARRRRPRGPRGGA